MPVSSPTVSRDVDRLWQAVLGRLELCLARANYDLLRNSRPVAIEHGCLIVAIQSGLAADWMNRSIRPSAAQALAAVADEELDIRFVGRGEAPNDQALASAVAPASDVVTSPVLGSLNARFSLERYLPARGNSVALNTGLSLVAEPGEATSMLAVWGAPGLGKSHLLHGIALRAVQGGLPVACLSAEDFTSRYQSALRDKCVEVFQAPLRRVRLFVLDDLQYLVGKPATQDELVHTIDAVTGSGGAVIVAGELHPMELDLPARLASRLSAGVIARIEPFDLEERRAFVGCAMRRARVALPAWAVDRLAALPGLSARLMLGAVNTACALQQSGRLDIASLDFELSRLIMMDSAPPSMGPDDLVRAVAAHYGATADELKGRSRRPVVATARAAAAAALKQQGLSHQDIAVILGGRDRSTVGPIVTRGQRLLEADAGLRARIA